MGTQQALQALSRRSFLRCDQGCSRREALGDITVRTVVRKSLKEAIDDYPMKGAKIDYERVTGVRKDPGIKNKTPKRK